MAEEGVCKRCNRLRSMHHEGTLRCPRIMGGAFRGFNRKLTFKPQK